MQPRVKILNKLLEMEFEDIELYYWAKDGWYLHCKEAKHFWIGQNYKHVLRQLSKEFKTKFDVLRHLTGIPEYMFNENKEYIWNHQE